MQVGSPSDLSKEHSDSEFSLPTHITFVFLIGTSPSSRNAKLLSVNSDPVEAQLVTGSDAQYKECRLPPGAWFNCLHATLTKAVVAAFPHTLPHLPSIQTSRRPIMSLENLVSRMASVPLQDSCAVIIRFMHDANKYHGQLQLQKYDIMFGSPSH